VIGSRLLRSVLWFMSASTLLTWVAFFSNSSSFPSPNQCGAQLELARPVPDLWLIFASALGAIGLRKGKSWGRLLGTSAAGAMLYAMLLDISFELENGLFLMQHRQILRELFAAALSLTLATYVFFAILKSTRSDQRVEIG
jgi:hypothetical protein